MQCNSAVCKRIVKEMIEGRQKKGSVFFFSSVAQV